MEETVKNLLEQKLNVMENLLNITQRISEIIKREDTEELLIALNDRQQLINNIDQIDTKLLNFFNDDISGLIKYTLGDCKLRAVHNNILSLLKKIKEIDDINLDGIKALFSKLKEDICKLRQTETALKGYGIIGAGSRDGAFIDTKK